MVATATINLLLQHHDTRKLLAAYRTGGGSKLSIYSIESYYTVSAIYQFYKVISSSMSPSMSGNRSSTCNHDRKSLRAREWKRVRRHSNLSNKTKNVGGKKKVV